MTGKLKREASSLAAALDRARALAPRLAEATDKLNEAIGEVERSLQKLQLGVRAEVELPQDPEGWYETLAFAKDGKTWRLLAGAGHAFDPSPNTYMPLVNASRETRLRSVEFFPLLVDKLLKEAEAEFSRVEERTAEAKALAASLATGGRR